MHFEEREIATNAGTCRRLFPRLQKRFSRKVRTRDILIFNREFAVLTKAGLSIIQALDVILEKGSGESLPEILGRIRVDISKGESLSGAFGKYPDIFGSLYLATLLSGEKNGNIASALSRYVDYLKKITDLRQRLISASIYPVILVSVSAAAVIFLLAYVVPSFTSTYLETGNDLPRITQTLVEIGTFVKNNLLFLLIGFVSATFIYAAMRRSREGKARLDMAKIKSPFVGRIYLYYYTSRLSRTLATTLRGGATLLEALQIATRTLGNSFLQTKLEEAARSIEQGRGFSESLSETGEFPLLAVRLIQAGENSGALEEVLDDVADFLEKDVDAKVSMVMSSLEPAMMVVMGLLIGFIVLAMYMPIFQMAGTLG